METIEDERVEIVTNKKSYLDMLELKKATLNLNLSKLNRLTGTPVSTIADRWRRVKNNNKVEALILVNGRIFCRSEVC